MYGKAVETNRFTRAVVRCPVCASDNLVQVAEAGPSNTRIVSCQNCGMFISTPTLPFEKLQVFYCEEFEGDAGSAAARRNGKVVGSFERQLKIARRRELPLVLRHIEDLKGKSVLDLRSRSGALAMAMQERGATVVASDPMLPNVELCHRAGLKAYQIGVFEHSDLSEFQASSFDAVTGLTIHVLAHLPEPDAFLRRTFDLLKPGGLLILNEKNVFKPARKSKPGIFASGIGHFYHFTPKTLEGMIKAAGFERVEVFDHPQRASAYRHMIAVARKPDNGLPAVYPVFRQDMEHVRAERAKAERSARLRAPFNRVKRRVRQAVKSLSRKISGP